MVRRIVKSPYFWTLLVAALVTLPLIALTLRAAALVEIHVIANRQYGATLENESVLTRAYHGPAYFEFNAELTDPEIEKAVLKIRPENSREYFSQGLWSVEKGHVRGVAQLGSDHSPVNQDEHYSFVLVAPDENRTLADGEIIATVNELAVNPGWLIFVIGLLASVVQISQTVVMGLWRDDRSSEPPSAKAQITR